MKICIVNPRLISPPFKLGGEVSIWSHALALAGLGHKVTFLSYGIGKSCHETIDGLELISKEAFPPLTYRRRPWLIPFLGASFIPRTRFINQLMLADLYHDVAFAELLKQVDCDLVQLEVIGYVPAYEKAWSMAKRLGVPYVIHCQDIYSLYFTEGMFPGATSRLVLRTALNHDLNWFRKAQMVLTVSERDLISLNRLGITRTHNVNATVAPFLLSKRRPTLEGIDESKLVLVPAGSRQRSETIQWGIYFANALPNLIIAMPGVSKEETNFGRSHLPGNFIPCGTLDYEGMNYLYEIARLVVVPTRHTTGISMRVVEAFLHGRAVLTTASTAGCFGKSDFSGFVIENELTSFPRAIRRVFDDEDFSNRLSSAARERAKEFTFEFVSKRVAEVYGGMAEDENG